MRVFFLFDCVFVCLLLFCFLLCFVLWSLFLWEVLGLCVVVFFVTVTVYIFLFSAFLLAIHPDITAMVDWA